MVFPSEGVCKLSRQQARVASRQDDHVLPVVSPSAGPSCSLRVEHGVRHFGEMTGFGRQTSFSATKRTGWYG
jgi:hypothetical protein